VKIVFADDDRLAGLLRPGMSVDVSIDTRAHGVRAASQARRD
jgi:multidrug resistance efflux pump